MSIHETMKQITEIAETLVVSGKVQGYVISEGQQNKNERCIIFHNDTPGKTELVLGDDFEVKVEDGKTFVVRKTPQYPKIYEECCELLFPSSMALGKVLTSGYNCELLKKFGELLICRDAYWKLAGDWKPYWSIYDHKFCIGTDKDIVIAECVTTGNRILAFPTKEMRDAFYENFNGLIEECKELL